MESKPPPYFNYDSIRDDVSRITAILKSEKEEYSADEILPDHGSSTHLTEDSEPPLERIEVNSNSLQCVTEFSGETGTDFAAYKSDEASFLPVSSAEAKFNAALENCTNLKEAIARSLKKLEDIGNDIELKQDYLAVKLEVARKLEYEEKKKIKYYKPINLFATPYFRDVKGSVPSPNEDSKMKKLNGDIDAYTVPPRPWTAPECECLQFAVIEDARRQELEPLSASRDYYKDKLENGVVTEEQGTEIEEKLENIIQEIEYVRKKSDDELLASDNKLDWMRIAASMLDFNRTADQCERMWRNCVHPSINKKKWTDEEDQELRKIAEKCHYKDWEHIASELTYSKRTAIQCLQRYQSSLNPKMLKSIWSPEDDEELLRVVEACRNGSYIPWNQVSYHIDGRKRLQIVNRWTRSIAPYLKKTPWSPEEDAILLAAVEKYGYKWAKITDLLPGRSNFSCRERFTNVLAPGVVIGNWTPEEDSLLIKLARKFSEGKWSKIAEHFSGRTDNMCLQRLSRIKKHHPELFEPNTCPSENEDDPLPEEYSTPTHNCKVLNSHRKNIRLTALENMARTVMQVKGLSSVEEAREQLTKNKVSRKFLLQLSRKLLSEEGKNAEKRERNSEKSSSKTQGVRARRYVRNTGARGRKGRKRIIGTKSRKSKRPFDQTSSDSDDISVEYDDSEEEEEFSERMEGSDEDIYVEETFPVHNVEKTEEEKMVDKQLDALFMPVLLYGVRTSRSKGVHRSAKEVMERRMLKSFLYRALQCNVYEEDTDDETEYSSRKMKEMNCEDTLPPVIKSLVFSPVDQEEIPVFPPNRTTLEAFKYLLINYQQLQLFFSENPCQDTYTISLLSTEENHTLTCAPCYKTKNYVSPSGIVVVNKPDHSKNDIGDQSGMDSAVEAASDYELFAEPFASKTSIPCKECEHLNALRRDFHILRRRLFSLFFWPTLLTMTLPTDEQKTSVLEQETFDKSPVKRSVKKRQRSSKNVKETAGSDQVPTSLEVTKSSPQKMSAHAEKQVEKVVKKSPPVNSVNATRKSPRSCN